MKLEPGEQRPCAACGERIVGALTRDGRVAPVALAPKATGNVLLYRTPTGLVHCRTFAGSVLAALRDEGVPLRTNHFADCAEAERLRGAPATAGA